ncbi:hypothetical protein BDC45DRAFT_565994 [Circinella umbellata]|nr:hypothetical protein BDC45DRAFT_565994 [Circinella umbellata]
MLYDNYANCFSLDQPDVLASPSAPPTFSRGLQFTTIDYIFIQSQYRSHHEEFKLLLKETITQFLDMTNNLNTTPALHCDKRKAAIKETAIYYSRRHILNEIDCEFKGFQDTQTKQLLLRTAHQWHKKALSKAFIQETTEAEVGGYLIYRLYNDGRTVDVRRGHDCVLMSMHHRWNNGSSATTTATVDNKDETDEMTLYYDALYVSALESFWRRVYSQ